MTNSRMRWQLMKSRWPNHCYLCREEIYVGDNIAWHPTTKQTLHVACFTLQFHPENVRQAAVRN